MVLLMAFLSNSFIKNLIQVSAATYHLILGITYFGLLVYFDFRLLHIGMIGIINIMIGYGLVKKRVWSIWMVVVNFFVFTTFSVYSILVVYRQNFFLSAGFAICLVLTWLFAFRIIKQKDKLKK